MMFPKFAGNVIASPDEIVAWQWLGRLTTAYGGGADPTRLLRRPSAEGLPAMTICKRIAETGR
jgi:hypothetical protein